MTINETTEFLSALGQAIALWSAGKRISTVLAAQLIEQGYDLRSLERAHFKLI